MESTSGDIHSHIVKIDLTKTKQFTTDGTKAYPWVTAELACLMCHNSDPDAKSNFDLKEFDTSGYQTHD